MDRGVDATGWPYPARYAGAVTAGVAWALLWVGMFALQLNPLVFWVASLVLAAPVLATLGRTPRDHVGMAVSAYVASVLVSFLLVPLVGSDVPTGSALVVEVVRRSAFAWSPAWAAIVLIHAVRRRRPTELPTAKSA